MSGLSDSLLDDDDFWVFVDRKDCLEVFEEAFEVENSSDGSVVTINEERLSCEEDDSTDIDLIEEDDACDIPECTYVPPTNHPELAPIPDKFNIFEAVVVYLAIITSCLLVAGLISEDKYLGLASLKYDGCNFTLRQIYSELKEYRSHNDILKKQIKVLRKVIYELKTLIPPTVLLNEKNGSSEILKQFTGPLENNFVVKYNNTKGIPGSHSFVDTAKEVDYFKKPLSTYTLNNTVFYEKSNTLNKTSENIFVNFSSIDVSSFVKVVTDTNLDVWKKVTSSVKSDITNIKNQFAHQVFNSALDVRFKFLRTICSLGNHQFKEEIDCIAHFSTNKYSKKGGYDFFLSGQPDTIPLNSEPADLSRKVGDALEDIVKNIVYSWTEFFGKSVEVRLDRILSEIKLNSISVSSRLKTDISKEFRRFLIESNVNNLFNEYLTNKKLKKWLKKIQNKNKPSRDKSKEFSKINNRSKHDNLYENLHDKKSGFSSNKYENKNKIGKIKNNKTKISDLKMSKNLKKKHDKYLKGKPTQNIHKLSNSNFSKDLTKDGTESSKTQTKNNNEYSGKSPNKRILPKEDTNFHCSFSNERMMGDFSSAEASWFFNLGKLRSVLRWEQTRGDWLFERARARRGKG